MAGAVEKIKSGFTTRAIILSIIIMVVGLFANTATWWGLGITLEPVFAGRVGVSIYPPYGLMFVLVLASGLLVAAGLTLQEIVVVTTVAFVAADSPFVLGAFLEFIFSGTYMIKTSPSVATVSKFYPGLWTPGLAGYSIISPAWTGGANVPLGSLAPYLGFWMFMATCWCLIMLFQASILRLQLVKKEKLPFPSMVPMTEMLSEQAEHTFLSYVKSVPFLIGLALGALIGILGALNYIYKFTAVFYAFGRYYLTFLTLSLIHI